MNAMMPIHISNSNGSHAIIFHIIQTFMLTHQLACINISFPIHISSHSIQAIAVLPSTHHSCSSCQATTYKQFHMDHFVPTTIRTIFNSPKSVRGLSMDDPLTKHRFRFVEPRIYGHFRPHNTQTPFFMAF